MSKAQMTGMRGVYLVAAELTRLGFIVSPTSRSAQGADLLVVDKKCKKAFSVQVKTNAVSFNFWLLGKGAQESVSSSHVYVLVNIRSRSGLEEIEYFVVPSKTVAKLGMHDGTWANIGKKQVEKFRDKWSAFGDVG